MSTRMQVAPPQVFKHQADATLTQANPVSGTKYTLLDTTQNVRIILIAVKVTWSVQPTPLEVHITIDGQSITGSFTNPASATWYYASHFDAAGALLLKTDANNLARYKAFLLEGRSVKIELEITGGTVSELAGRAIYQKIP